MIWWGAMLPYLEKKITLDQFAGEPLNDKDRVARFHAAWDKVDRALRH